MCAPSFLVCACLTACVHAHSLEGTMVTMHKWLLQVKQLQSMGEIQQLRETKTEDDTVRLMTNVDLKSLDEQCDVCQLASCPGCHQALCSLGRESGSFVNSVNLSRCIWLTLRLLPLNVLPAFYNSL